jgi:general nucleoside transport system ATP-binding protein
MTTEARSVAIGRPLLKLVGITKRFPGVTANEGINLEVLKGEIHGLLGENGAGKTTLMNVVFGLIRPDEGQIEVDGTEVEIGSPKHALELGIGMVHQHFMLVPEMTIAENIALTLHATRLRRARLEEVGARVRELSSRFGLQVNPDDRVEDVSVGVQQRVEILKLLYRGAELLILDEPTAALTPPEWQDLSAVLQSLVAEGKSVIFITHKLDELFGVANRCTVLRDGMVVGTMAMAETTKPALARMMVGRDVTLRIERTRHVPGEPVLEVRDLCVEENGRSILQDVTFDVREREILGIAGVDGNGQRELVEALIGLRPLSSGQIRIRGQHVDGMTPERFARHGGAVIPEDRHRAGTALDLSLLSNLMMKDYFHPPFVKRGVLNVRAAREHCQRLVAKFDIRTPSLDVLARQLSGGNQQKAVLARELHWNPRLLIAAQPTRGLDVGAMEFVYRQLLSHVASNGAVLLISIELDEILSLSDRIAVIVGGSFLRIIDAREADPELLGLLMAGELEHSP